ncbi:DNA mismatch repair endonuclease MutL [Psychrobacter urativorans]|uniref:DNA mismatch repair protein MutL n=1 Tax=Psychrobacter urativorans TaxID=45610 RepID=A0A0M4T5V3_9GAMM|nr:DNA mismatch repair endonuclease MutL [Psychrobacter urativorans]ALF58646.1 ATPase [Psychrobacter urativorans]
MPDNSTITRIKKLSPLLINQLAAGEVVTRPAAVVKELLENAIDAGATHIEVRITQGGMGMIEVVDNGLGIHPDDMVMAITRHATSKVADIATLQGINTLGFRGEALSAVAAVSRLTLTSSHDDSGVGRQLHVAGILADTPKLTPVVHNRGTTVTVKDLYFNVPARRGNLKSIGTEFAHIETIVREVALARADVTLSLFHDNKKRLLLSASLAETDTNNNNSRLPLSRLEQALGIALTSNAIPITIDLSSLLQSGAQSIEASARISGWLWTSQQSQSQTTLPKLLYVNGRLVKEVLISNQLRQLAASAQLDGIGYALYFDLPTQWLNVNVHPTKQRIRISPLNNIMAHLGHAIGLKLKSIIIPKIATPVVPVKHDVEQDVESKSINKVSYVSSTPVHQQVQAPKQLYKVSQKKILSENNAYASADGLTPNQGSNTAFMSSASTHFTSLPQCLEIIQSLPKNTSLFTSLAVDSTHLSSLPWLLLYWRGRYLLMSVQDWQAKLALLNKPYLFNKAETPVSAAMINQQIVSVAAPLSAQDSSEFTNTLEQLLHTSAIAVIDTEQLVTVMLSSAPTSLFS